MMDIQIEPDTDEEDEWVSMDQPHPSWMAELLLGMNDD